MKTMHQTWEGCYDRQWGDYITSASFAHPAKMARGLLERIIQHGFERGWFHRGDTIADCFGGVGTTGIIGAYRGLKVYSVELEKKFVSLARRNYALHASKWKTLGCPRPVMLQGDSRQFDRLIGDAVGVVSSPPYAGISPEKSSSSINIEKQWQTYRSQGGGMSLEKFRAQQARHREGYGNAEGQISSLPCGSVAGCPSSPPYADIAAGAGGLNTKPARKPGQQSGRTATLASQNTDQKYGRTDGQISQLPSGEVSAVLSSPPYAEGLAKAAEYRDPEKASRDASRDIMRSKAGKANDIQYGYCPGEIGRLKGGSVQGVVSSPPFQSSMSDNPSHKILGGSGGRMGQSCKGDNYGDSPGQIGREKQETYWIACKQVYAAVFRTIKPNGVMVLVTKDFVRNGKRVPLSDDTVTLCESLGFVLIERIRAMLVSHTTHGDLFNGSDVKTKSRKSFFRRIHEAKPGAVKIDWEDVLVFRIP